MNKVEYYFVFAIHRTLLFIGRIGNRVMSRLNL